MEQLKNKNDIEIKLLPNRRFIYANRKSNIVITAEHNATGITVLFPEEYEEYSKRVDFINSQGKEWTEGLYTPEFKNYKPGVNKTRFHFTLPTEVTTEGELKMQFLAYLSDESMTTVPFEVIPIDVINGSLAFKRSSRGNPDLLILAANKAEQALFNSQKAVVKSEKAVKESGEAAAAAKTSETATNAALEAVKAAERNAAEAADYAVRANENADSALAAAEDARAVAAESLGIAASAEGNSETAIETANKAKQVAVNAEGLAVAVVEKAERGEFKGDKGDTGDTGPPGKDAVMFATDNLLGFYVDENGDIYAYAGDSGGIDFRYDEVTGELFLIYL